MESLSCKIVSSITAALVLASSVLCACGIFTKAAACSSPEAKPATKQGHCDHCPGGGEKRDPTPSPRKNDSGCRHCQSALTAQTDGARDGALASYSPQLCLLPAVWSNPVIGQSAFRRPMIKGDLPPPIGCPTLLNLHCALIA